MIALVVLFMVLPAISLVNINVSRIMERASEIGVRKSFGAASTTLIGQFVVENVLLSLMGGIIGIGFTEVVLYLLSNSYLIPYAEFHINYRVFVYGLLMAMFFGVFAGVYPAWKMSRLHPVEALRRK
jgi:putative ABC transport system permease protein